MAGIVVLLGIFGVATKQPLPHMYKKVEGKAFTPAGQYWMLSMQGAGGSAPDPSISIAKQMANALGAKAFMPTPTGLIFAFETPNEATAAASPGSIYYVKVY